VDDLGWLTEMLRTLAEIAGELPVWFPIHPRTRQRLADAGMDANAYPGVRLLDPVPYVQFLGLQTQATVVITDSGGIQEETTFLGRPCLTVRENTERPVTVELGTNVLVGRDMDRLRQELQRVLGGGFKKGSIPPLWDGHAAERIAEVLTGATTLAFFKEAALHV
jgi:UDP-N-acetylglucosamine 2-epimerase (non-hydrolysing)